MLKFLSSCTIFLCWLMQSNAQKLYDNLPKTISIFLPDKYKMIDTTQGYLNHDNIKDIIIVIEPIVETVSAGNDLSGNRTLLILFGQTGRTYKLYAKSKEVVKCNMCGGVAGDPFAGIEITKGYFTVKHFGGSTSKWEDAITFKFNKHKRKFYLHRREITNFNPEDLENEDEKKIITTEKDFGIISFEAYHDNEQ